MRRRDLIAIFGSAAIGWPFAAEPQQVGKVYRIGILAPGPPSVRRSGLDVFREGLRELGYREGQQIIIEERWADADRTLPALADELTRLKPDAIVVLSGAAALAAKRATATVPIVLAGVPDPVGSGMVVSIARPGGNITGVTLGWDAEFVGKWLEVLKEVVPNASRVALLWSSPVTTIPVLENMRVAARVLHVVVESFDARDSNELEGAFRTLRENRLDGLFVFPNPFTIRHRATIVALAASLRIPALYGDADFVGAGGLISYSSSVPERFRRAASFVDKILKGAKPSDLPVEQLAKIQLVINLKTAKALGITIPPSLLARADEVIE
ncbi:MAG: ABC transporter substrate-binding protein [Proteobacteria bacterium]|nr:ABC transporter substrate-binding protein [Pseudomonadota bacterium]